MVALNFKASIEITESGKPTRFSVVGAGDSEDIDTYEELAHFTKSSLIQISDQVLAEEQSKGFDKKPVLIVDNKFNLPKEAVNPFGKIEYAARQSLKEIALFIYDAISQRSVSNTGTYKRYNIMTVNNNIVAQSRQEIEAYFTQYTSSETGVKIRFINATPYARMLERHSIFSKSTKKKKWRKSKDSQGRSGIAMSGKQGMFVLAENGAYFQAARASKQKYGKNSYIQYESLPGTYIGIDKMVVTGPKGVLRKTYKPTGDPYLYPTILFYVQESGIKGD